MSAAAPLIGLNTSVAGARKAPAGTLSVPLAYVDAILEAGGIPLLVPPYRDPALLETVLERLDGFCFIGAPDYPPACYGGRVQKAEALMEARRGAFDLPLARRVLERTALPVLGICGGLQLINIARGGSLVQDLRTEWDAKAVPAHARPDGAKEQTEDHRHPLRVEPGSRIAAILQAPQGRVLETNSFHHQAVRPDGLGRGLRAVAWAPDGVIEALEAAPGSDFARAGRFVLGVQWHPEKMPFEERQRALFRALVEAARRGP